MKLTISHKKYVYTILSLTFAIGFYFLLTPRDKAESNNILDDKLNFTFTQEYIKTIEAEGFSLKIDNNITNINPAELGVSFTNSASRFDQVIARLLNKELNYRVIFNSSVIEQNVKTINKSFISGQKAFIFADNNDWVLSKIEKEKFIDIEKFKESILYSLNNEHTYIDVPIEYRWPDIYYPTEQELDNLKSNLTRPINIAINNFGEIIHITLKTNELYPILEPRIEYNSINVSINKKMLRALINTKTANIDKTQEIKLLNKRQHVIESGLDRENLSQRVYEIINNRQHFNNHVADINISTKYLPATKGEYDKRYIEIDLSQQRLYVWDEDKLIDEMALSSGYNYTTPTGEFEIQNKADNPYSDIDNSYMPNWMSFYKHPKFNAWLGFHALTYKINSRGKYTYEPESDLGKPASGGCIKLGRSDALKLYNWAEVGDKVLIHD